MLTKMIYAEILTAIGETLTMVSLSSLFSIAIGLPLGLFLFVTRQEHLVAKPWLNRVSAALVNALRSIPFIILLISIIPFTRLIVGTSIGVKAAIVPLTVTAIPFVARIIENALAELPLGLIEAGLSMGASPLQIIRYILLPEALPNIINGMTLMIITLVGYSSMAGAVGGGGLGDLAIRYGYQRFDNTIMLITVILLIAFVQCIQLLGDRLVKIASPLGDD